MKITHKITADLQNSTVPPRLAMVQCDYNSREVEVTVTSGNKAWIPENMETVFLRYRKSDGTGGSYDALPDGTKAWAVEENRVTVCIAPQMLTVPGLVEAQLVLKYDKQYVATFSFYIVVERDPSIGTVESENYVNWIQWAREALDDLLEQAKESGDFAGAFYLPAVDAAGNLSWSNDAGMDNPEPVNLADLIAGKINGDILQGNVFGHMNMNGYRIRSLAAPEASDDAATKAYTDSAKKDAVDYARKVGAPRNLLDNSNFTNLVNQRGVSTVNGHTTLAVDIDRWWSLYAKLQVTENGLKFAWDGKNGAAGYVQQHLQYKGSADRATIAAEIDGTVYSAIIEIASGTVTAEVADDLQFAAVLVNGVLSCSVHTTATEFKCIKWIALYEGAFTAEALPEFQPRGYAAELAECERYFRRLEAFGTMGYSAYITGSGLNICVNFGRCTMRVNPTMTLSSDFKIVLRTAAGTYAEATGSAGTKPTGFQWTAIRNNILTTTFVYETASTPNNAPAAVTIVSGYADFSADL